MAWFSKSAEILEQLSSIFCVVMAFLDLKLRHLCSYSPLAILAIPLVGDG